MRKSWAQAPAAIILIIAASFLIYKTNILPAKANYATTRGIIQGWGNNFPGAVAKFKESVLYDVPGKYEYRHRFAQYLLEYSSGKALAPELIEALQFAISEVEKNTLNNELDYLPYLYLSRLNIVLGKDDKSSLHNDIALQHSMKALEISPTFIRTYYEIAQAYLNVDEHDKAIEYFRRAAELNPDVGISYWYWGVTEYERGNTAEGLRIIDQALNKRAGLSEGDYGRLVNIYNDANDIPRLVKVFEQLIAIAPGNAQYRASLAVAYARIGRIDEALESARMAVRLDPAFRADAEAFARSLGREL